MHRASRRTVISGMAAAPLVASLPGCVTARDNASPVTRRLGAMDQVPIIGIGTARNFADPQTAEDQAELRATLQRFADLGGKVIDTAPSYGRAEEVVGQLVEDLGIRGRLYLATKVGTVDLEAGKQEIDASFARLRTDFIDLIAVHNLRNTSQTLAYLRDLRAAGRIGAIGITTSSDQQYEDFIRAMEVEEIDSIQVDYALDNRNAAERILPLAMERGIAPLINLPFGRGRLFTATQGMPLPDWATEIGATSWAQVFLKYIVSHPSRPVAIPGTARVRYAEDNFAAALPPMPDPALRRRMEQFVDSL